MVPGTWLSVLLFFLLVAPGLLFDLLSARRRAGISESTFREVSRVVLASLVFTAAAVGVLSVVRLIWPRHLADPASFLQLGSRYLEQHLGRVLATVAAELVIALAIALVAHSLLAWWQGGATIRPVSAWSQVFKRDCPPRHDAYVRVRLADGTIYSGLVANFSSDLETDDRELVLAQPLASRSTETSLSRVPPAYQRVVIRGNVIQVMSVEYRPKLTAKPTSARTRLRDRMPHRLRKANHVWKSTSS